MDTALKVEHTHERVRAHTHIILALSDHLHLCALRYRMCIDGSLFLCAHACVCTVGVRVHVKSLLACIYGLSNMKHEQA